MGGRAEFDPFVHPEAIANAKIAPATMQALKCFNSSPHWTAMSDSVVCEQLYYLMVVADLLAIRRYSLKR